METYKAFMGQSIQSLEELQDLVSSVQELKNLNLHANRIQSMHGPRFDNLIELVLSSNDIKRIEFTANFPVLEHLDLSCNRLESLDNLRFCTALKTLTVAYNRIASLRGLQEMWGKQYSLTKLDVRENRIEDLNELIFLGGLINCTECSFRSKGRAGNTICDDPNYRSAVVQSIPGLLLLDDVPCEEADKSRTPILSTKEASRTRHRNDFDNKNAEHGSRREKDTGALGGDKNTDEKSLDVLRHELRIENLEKRFGGWATTQLADSERRFADVLQKERDAHARELASVRAQCSVEITEAQKRGEETYRAKAQEKQKHIAADLARVDAEFRKREALRAEAEEKVNKMQGELDTLRGELEKERQSTKQHKEEGMGNLGERDNKVSWEAELSKARAQWERDTDKNVREELEKVKKEWEQEIYRTQAQEKVKQEWVAEKARLEKQVELMSAQVKMTNEQATERLRAELGGEVEKMEALRAAHASEIQANEKRYDALRVDFDAVHEALEKRNAELNHERVSRGETEEHKKALLKDVHRMEEEVEKRTQSEVTDAKQRAADREAAEAQWKEEIRTMEARHKDEHRALDAEVKRVIGNKHKELECARAEVREMKKVNEDVVRTLHRSAEQDRVSKHMIDQLKVRLEKTRLEAKEAAEGLRKAHVAQAEWTAAREKERDEERGQRSAHEQEKEAAIAAHKEAECSMKSAQEAQIRLMGKLEGVEARLKDGEALAEARAAEIKLLQGEIEASKKLMDVERGKLKEKMEEAAQAYELKVQMQATVANDHASHVQQLKSELRKAKEDVEQWKDTVEQWKEKLERKEKKWNETMAKGEQWEEKCLETEAVCEELRREIGFLKEDLQDKEEALKFASTEVEELKQLFDTRKREYEDGKHEAEQQMERAVEKASDVDRRIAEAEARHAVEVKKLETRMNELVGEKAKAEAKVTATENEMRVLLVETQRTKQKFQDKMGKMEEFVTSLKHTDTGWL